MTSFNLTPFHIRAADFCQIAYEFEYDTEEHAIEAFKITCDKRVVRDSNNQITKWPLGRRMRSRNDRREGKKVYLIGQYLTEDVEAGSSHIAELEQEVAGEHGTMVSKAKVA